MKRLILSMLTCVTLTAYSAYAYSIEAPFSIALSGGMMRLIHEQDMSFGVKFDPANTADNAADTVVGGNPIATSMTDDGLNGSGSLSFGYTNTDRGVGVNLELAYNAFDINGEGDKRFYTFATRMVSLFLNFDYHSVVTASNSASSNVGLYTSFGFGAISLSNANGSFQFDVNRAASTAIVDTSHEEVSFNDYRGLTFGSNIKLGVEGIISSNFVLGVNAVFGMTFGDIALKGGAANLPPIAGVLYQAAVVEVKNGDGSIATRGSPAVPAVPSAKFLQSVDIIMPATYYGVVEIRVAYFM